FPAPVDVPHEFVFIEDAARALTSVADSPGDQSADSRDGRRFTVGTEPTTVNAFTRNVYDMAETNGRIRGLPAWMLRGGALFSERVEVVREILHVFTHDTTMTGDVIREAVGFEPRTDYEDGIRRTVAWFEGTMMELWNRRSRALFAAVGLGFGGYAFAVILVLLAAGALLALGVPVLDRPSLTVAVSIVMGQGVAFGLFALRYLRYTGRGFDYIKVRVPNLNDFGWTVGGFVVFYGGLIAVSVVLTTFGIQSAQNEIATLGEQDPRVFLLLIPLSFLLIGPGEELLYRGVVQERLRESFGRWPAIALASLIFAFVHVFSLQGQDTGIIVYLGILFVLSPILGAAYEYTRNLVVPALIHGAFNALQFGLAYLMMTGQLPS
ncbi:type II CAAX prenyl endopeptidase Rce1 family protein, partial [Haladaptatus pallidirubidus]|uniref:CPBP family glutamic-type intramembrane protease n=1 Tax=Haladaptatus pallidirubidus TaxID=1008152 RepID=UPI0035EFA0FA